MNRILLESSEIDGGKAVFGGARAEHVLKVLHGEIGQVIKTGEIGGLIGTSEITEITNGSDGPQIAVSVSHTDASLGPWVDIVLAPPRPRIFKRLLPQLAAMGVGRIFLIGAKKVEKDFWGATVLKPENYRPLLIDGLMQGCVSSDLPVVETRRNFRRFVSDELDTLCPTPNRIVAHPYGGSSAPAKAAARSLPTLLAIGPEGGWTDEEVALLEAHGFARYSLGRRVLRTDTATVALLSRLMTD